MNEDIKKPDSQPEAELSADSSPEILELPANLEPSIEEKLGQELKDSQDRLLRLAAEFENFKKISQREQQNSLKFANESLIISLLPLIDSLEQAVKAGKKADSSKDLLIGVEMVLKLFTDTLQRFGVEFFSAIGQSFDPARHEAIGECESESAPGTVVEQVCSGCLLNNRLVRAARVIVAKAPVRE